MHYGLMVLKFHAAMIEVRIIEKHIRFKRIHAIRLRSGSVARGHGSNGSPKKTLSDDSYFCRKFVSFACGN